MKLLSGSIYFQAQITCWYNYLTDTVQPGLFYKHLVINSLTDLSFSSISSNHLLSKIIKARELFFLENNNLPLIIHVSYVTCHVSGVMCHMSHVTYPISCFTCFFVVVFFKVLKLVDGGSVINGAYPVRFEKVESFHQLVK